SGSHPHVLPLYAPVRALAPPCIHRLLDGQEFQKLQAYTRILELDWPHRRPGVDCVPGLEII
ncbi:MAG: hypothetical protein ACREQ7_08630, partial [Candidatus Binatia bacterium]